MGRRFQAGAGREPDPLPEVHVHRTRVYFFPWLAGSLSGAAGGSTGGGFGGNDDRMDEEEFSIGADAEEVDGSKADESGSGGAAGQEEGDGVQQGLKAGRRLRQQRRLAYDTHPPGRHFDRRVLPPLRTRPASAQEPTDYLAHSAMSTCTVPIVFYPIFPANFAHSFHDVTAFLFSLLRRTPWRDHAKLVVVTPDGLGMTQPEAQLLPVLSNLSVQTWADFSRRLPPGYDPQADLQAGPPASFEGGEQRCFDQLFVCGRRFQPDSRLPTEPPLTPEEQAEHLSTHVPRENYALGQALVQWYRERGLVPPAPAPHSPDQELSSGIAMRRLRILFMRRDSGGRQLLNAEELVHACNAWRYRLPSGGAEVVAECRQVELPSLEAGIAAAQEADVFVGVHGANMANSYMMRPGSSAIEITPLKFGRIRGAFGPCKQNGEDASSQLLWWSAVVCDPALSTPGPDEAARRGPSHWWPRDRNTRVPWPVLAAILEEVVQLGGDRERYLREYYLPGRHRFHFRSAGVVSRGDQALCAAGPA